ncbi:MAG: hypothetical protein KJ900_00855 [Proteobacteria bacterium]|jgi:plasmid maintenance system antidote protein VapI|nr:helix-turn-helix domain-containing protein [Desulfocapsa sp.]MBU3943882.1 hypothetical protein [Pseudomonadota bacterium]MCG2742955.1 hypothetical protein [Desulfobacteraceae bacterium]MBU4027969.1 hypothetical protein [Pseudomonadota bacterium]MBU4041440.1 hypothetical protein [Pseudomonadota bacterium]
MNNTSNDCFVAALQYRLQEQGRGSKKQLVRHAEVSPNHLSDILAMRRNAGQQLKERFAQGLGTTVEEMLTLGRRILASKEIIDNTSLGQKQATNTGKSALSLMEMAAQILQSNSVYQKFLSENIQSYYQAMESDAMKNLEEQDLRLMMQELSEKIQIWQNDLSNYYNDQKNKA